MECITDRLDMLKHLTMVGGESVSIFSEYIPDHYNEIYTLYEMLNRASIDYNQIDFFKPVEKGDSFVFLCSFDNSKDYESLESFIAKNNGKVKFMRKKSFIVSICNDESSVRINFTLA